MVMGRPDISSMLLSFWDSRYTYRPEIRRGMVKGSISGRPYGDGTSSGHEKLQGIRSGHDAAHADKGDFTAR